MNNLIIVGGGGFCLELIDYLLCDSSFLMNFKLKGILDDKKIQNELSYLGKLDDYIPSDDDYFIIAIGNVSYRKTIFDKLISKGAKFYTYIHPSAFISKTAKLGVGCIIAPYTIVNAFAQIGDNVVLNVHSSVGHEAVIGDNTVFSPYCAANGCSHVGACCFLGTRSTIFPGVTLGYMSIVDSHSYVKSDAAEKSIISLRSDYSVLKNRFIR
ncbi:acetyltransferase [Aequoribacter fuscus]|uniref:acetyltransferase n=1 Tax=Aequoribacter fuscus TaxID=2518989 RepID=UPI000594F85F|nr:acetyltransferase [Aequoribacter fuscus]QHJ88878.1 acetyltransferase [Aequoribacter fuscus]